MDPNRAVFKNKGVVLVLLWILLINICDPTIAQHIKDSSAEQIISAVSSCMQVVLSLLLPLATLVADIKFGGFRFTLGSLVVGFLISILYSVQDFFALNVIHADQIAFEILLEVSSPLNSIFRKLFTIFMLLYGTDFMPDASSSQLSSFIWWYWCSIYVGHLITVLISCVADAFFSNSTVLLVVGITHFICLILILLSCIIFKRALQITDSRRKNPLTLIKGTISSAMTSRINQRYRSAFTYCETLRLSRIDFAKIQYGGTFKEEDVESVKAFFRLIPYLACVSLLYFPAVPLGRFQHSSHATTDCLLGRTYFVEYLIATVVIIFNQQSLVRSCCECSMFSKVGFGLLLIFLSKVAYVSTEAYISYHENDNNSTSSDMLNVSGIGMQFSNDSVHDSSMQYLMLLPQVVGSVGVAVSIPTSFEFIFAQCPYNMRGLVIGLTFAIDDISEELGWWSAYLFKFTPQLKPSREVYIYLSHVLVMLVCLVLFYIIGRWYKFRLRNAVFSHYSAAESYYTRLLQVQDELSN